MLGLKTDFCDASGRFGKTGEKSRPPSSFYWYLFRRVPLHLSSMPNLQALLRSKMVAALTNVLSVCLTKILKCSALQTASLILGILRHLIPGSTPLTQENPDFIKKSGYLPGGGALTQEGG